MTAFPILLFVRAAAVLAVALIAVSLLRRAPASLRYLVLATGLSAVLVLPVIEALVPAWHTGAIASVEPSVVEAPALPVAEAGPAATEIAKAVAAPAATTNAAAPFPWRALVGGLWLAGMALLLARVAIGSVRARRIAGRALPAPPSAARHIARAWSALRSSGEPPRVAVSSEIDAPIVIGSVFPVVIVPRASAEWTDERWRVVLLHELTHVRQRDGLANLVAHVVRAVHWMNPLAHVALRRLRQERELAADDAVLHDGARASTYAEHLLAIASGATQPAPTAALGMAEQFESRIVALLDGRPRRRIRLAPKLAAAATIGAVAVVAACVSPDDAPSAPRSPASPTATAPAATGSATLLQSFAEGELERAVAEHHATGAVAIVLDAKTGAPLVIATKGNADARVARAPGSTFKPFAFAAALENGVATASTTIDCEGGHKKYGDKQLHDASANGTLDLGGILAVSSNVCTAKLVEPLGDKLAESLRRYHFAAPDHIDTTSLEGATMAMGEGVKVSALDLAAAYTALADDGLYHAVGSSAGVRVMPADTARTVRTLMERVVTDPEGTGHAAKLDGVRVAGKTGTARSGGANDDERYYASFVGIVPADAPRFVVLVAFDGVATSGGVAAAPVARSIAARALSR